MDIVSHNRTAWNKKAREGSRWSEPVNPDIIDAARKGIWQVILTPNKSVPGTWFDQIVDKHVLCLASGGGQQAPILAAAGAKVTSLDNSDIQLEKDRYVAERDGLNLVTVQGDMSDLSEFRDQSFDLIFHPVSNLFVKAVRPVWCECYRVLKPNGRLLSGFVNPVFFLFDNKEMQETHQFHAKYASPYSDLTSLPDDQLSDIIKSDTAVRFGHSLEDQIGGQIAAGFIIAGFYEDGWDDASTPLNRLTPLHMATLAIKRTFL